MPIYEYLCPKCGEFEVTQRITEDALKRCPECRSKVRKLISQTSFQLKGSGWYITDYGRKGAAGGSEASSPKSDAKEGSSKESTSKEGGGESSAKESSAKESSAKESAPASKESSSKESKKSSPKASSAKAA